MLRAMEEIYSLAHARDIKLPPDSIETVMAGVNGLPEDATSSMHRDIAAAKPQNLKVRERRRTSGWRESGVEVPTHELIYEKLKPLEAKARAALR